MNPDDPVTEGGVSWRSVMARVLVALVLVVALGFVGWPYAFMAAVVAILYIVLTM